VLGLQLLQVNLTAGGDIVSAFEAANGWHADGVLLTGNTIGVGLLDVGMNAIAMHSGLPVECPRREDVEAGCLMAYVAAADFQSHRPAYFVDKILHGTKPGDSPIEQPSEFQFIVNVRTVKALGLTVPPDIAAQITEWIE
jgi:putative ABC transport system substrate-binding protein